jgi:6-phosphogluconolactonase
MDHAMMRVFSDAGELSREAAREVAELIGESDTAAPLFTIALAGGSTPRRMYEMLAADYGNRIDWSRVMIFWGDERFVAEDSPDSNYRMAREALLDHISIPPENIVPIRTTLFDSPQLAADAYEQALRLHFPADLPCFDLVLLGVGEDGHTASLFPGSPALDEYERWVAVTQAPSQPRTRLTLTPPVLANARRLMFVVSGSGKSEVMDMIINEPEQARERYPAARIAGIGEAVWFADRDALTPALSQRERE